MNIQEIDSNEAYKRLKVNHNANLIDVRTYDEWRTVGVPDLTSIKKKQFFLSGQDYWTKNLLIFLKII